MTQIKEFEKEMKQKYPMLKSISENEDFGEEQGIRYIAWLNFPYYSTDSMGGFFSFFSEEEFNKHITKSIRKWSLGDIDTVKKFFDYHHYYDEFREYEENEEKIYNAVFKMLYESEMKKYKGELKALISHLLKEIISMYEV